MTLILGIDPGSRITGYGVVRDTGRGCEYVASGCIRTGAGAVSYTHLTLPTSDLV